MSERASDAFTESDSAPWEQFHHHSIHETHPTAHRPRHVEGRDREHASLPAPTWAAHSPLCQQHWQPRGGILLGREKGVGV